MDNNRSRLVSISRYEQKLRLTAITYRKVDKILKYDQNLWTEREKSIRDLIVTDLLYSQTNKIPTVLERTKSFR